MTLVAGQDILVSDILPYFQAGEAIASGDAVAYDYSDGKIYKASAASFNARLNFIGFALAAIASGSSDYINITAIDKRTVVDKTIYYLSDTQGALSTAAGTISRRVGVGMGTTALFRWKNGTPVSPPFTVGTTFTSFVMGNLIYWQSAGVLATINGVAYGFNLTDSSSRDANAVLRPGDSVVLTANGGASTFGPKMVIFDV